MANAVRRPNGTWCRMIRRRRRSVNNGQLDGRLSIVTCSEAECIRRRASLSGRLGTQLIDSRRSHTRQPPATPRRRFYDDGVVGSKNQLACFVSQGELSESADDAHGGVDQRAGPRPHVKFVPRLLEQARLRAADHRVVADGTVPDAVGRVSQVVLDDPHPPWGVSLRQPAHDSPNDRAVQCQITASRGLSGRASPCVSGSARRCRRPQARDC